VRVALLLDRIMPRKQDWAQVEWEFLRFDPDYRALPSHDERTAYVHLWAACVHLRRDVFEKHEIEGEYMADMCGVSPELLARTVRVSGPRLIARGPRGSITVVGVMAKHSKLRWWNRKQLRPVCGPDMDRTGPDQTGQGPDKTGPASGASRSRSPSQPKSGAEQIAALEAAEAERAKGPSDV